MSATMTTTFLRRHLDDMTNTTSENEIVEDSSNMIATILSNFFLFVLIFGLSATVSIDSLKHQLGNKFALLTGVGMQFVIMPLLGFLSVFILSKGDDGFTQAMGITLLVVTSSPGGSYSNWWCSLFNADLALSVAMTAVSTMLSVVMLPANLLLYSHLAYGGSDNDETNIVAALDFGTLFISLGIVMGGIISGLFCSYKIQSACFQTWANRAANVSGIALILVSILLSSVGVETSFWNQHWKFYAGVAFPCIVGLSLANLLSRTFRLGKPECVAISIECCYQNTGIATSVAVTMFSDPEIRAQAVAVPLFYGLVEAALIGVYCVWAWKAGWTKAPASEKLCIVVSKTYEVDTEEPDGGDNTQEEDLEAGKADDVDEQTENDAPHVEERASHWWHFWKKNQLESTEVVSSSSATKAENQECNDLDANRNRVVSEDDTVVTELSAIPSIRSDDGEIVDTVTTSPEAVEISATAHDDEACPA
jgi:predicted Na+-dependent transporter